MVDSWKEEFGGDSICMVGIHGPGAYGLIMTPRWLDNRLYLFPSTSETRPQFVQRYPVRFAQLVMGCGNLPF